MKTAFAIKACLCLIMLSRVGLHAQSDTAQQLPLDIPSVMAFPIGVTRTSATITAWITAEDLNINSVKHRMLLVAGLDGSPDTTAAARHVMRRFYTDDQYASLRRVMALSAVVAGNPDGLMRGLINDNGQGGNPAVGYPPAGEYYNSRIQVESQYLWRWIGMHAPDRVVELIPGPQTATIDPAHRPADCLVRQLGQLPAANVGLIQGFTRSVKAGDLVPFADLNLENFRLDSANVKPIALENMSPARRELQTRIARSAREVADQLAAVYGHDLPTMAYIPAVACMARWRWARLIGNQEAQAEIERLVDDYVAGRRFGLTDKSSNSDIAGHILWGELFTDHVVERYRELAQAAADRAFDAQGQPLESMPGHNDMSDAVFMGCPILATVGRLTGDNKYYEMCLRHVRFMRQLNLREDGLHRHSPQDDTAWGRGNGFPALGLTLVLENLPENHPARPEILAAWTAHLRALLPHQDVTGAWHQVIDHPESYRELSCTCMITYAMARGVRMGWLSKQEFATSVDRGWQAIKARVASDGSLVDVCTGTGKMNSLREYLDRPAILGRDPRGGAMALLVATEMMQWPGPPNP